jgi:plasmid stabilization system protein ParE
MPAQVRVTGNFQASLDSIRDFLLAEQAASEFDRLLERLFEHIIPNLARFPDMGRDFAALAPLSREGEAALRQLRRNAGRGAACSSLTALNRPAAALVMPCVRPIVLNPIGTYGSRVQTVPTSEHRQSDLPRIAIV